MNTVAAYAVVDQFGIENLKPIAREQQPLGHYEVRVRMRACSLNYRDILMVRGQYNPKQPLPLVPLSDGVGEVVEVGSRVSRVAVGDRVAGIFAQGWTSGAPTRERIRSTLGGPVDGMLSAERVLDEEGVVRVPELLSDTEAATLPCAALTAWTSLVTQGDVGPGDTVLLQGTGGVSIFALRFAKLLGARVIITSSSGEKLERAQELGADHVINYAEVREWGRMARDFTGGVGVDHVVEVGGAGTLAQSLKAVRVGGHVSVIGVLAGAVQPVNVIPILMNNIRLQGIIVGSRDGFEAMNRAIAQHEVRPVIDRIFDFDDSVGAFEHLAAARHFGKVCISFR